MGFALLFFQVKDGKREGGMWQPETQYTQLGNQRIAYQTLGEGPIDLVLMPGAWSHVDLRWDHPLSAHFAKCLSKFSRLIVFDRRGTGASDPVPLDALPTWEQWTDDLLTVLDAAGSEQAALFASNDGGAMAMMFAASHPTRTSALILGNTTAHFLAEEDYPEGRDPQSAELIVAALEQLWGTETFVDFALPSKAGDEDFRRYYAKYLRAAASPSQAAAYLRNGLQLDVREALSSIYCPTLVLHNRDYSVINSDQARYMSERIPNSRYLELPGRDGALWTEDPDRVVGLIEEFLTGVSHEPDTDRVLATVLFTDIVGSTVRLAELGDRRWRELLDEHDVTVRGQLQRFRGKLVDSTGDGVLATFDGPGRAIRCAAALRGELRRLGIDIRVGLHTGEIELRETRIGGIAVHIGARVMDKGGGGDILVSSTVKDLVAGSGITFEDRGPHTLKGLSDEWRLFAVSGVN